MIRPGQPWGEPAVGEPDVTGHGDDADLARLVAAHPGERLRFVPDSACDLARAVGLTTDGSGGSELPLDVLDVSGVGTAVNVVVLGSAPDRLVRWQRRRPVTVRVDGQVRYDGPATTVVVATGQFLRGADLVPRGHPGDGRVEIQVYALAPGARAEARRRLATGGHVPHPQITTATGRTVEVTWLQPAPVEVDGHPLAPAATVGVRVVPGAYRLLV